MVGVTTFLPSVGPLFHRAAAARLLFPCKGHKHINNLRYNHAGEKPLKEVNNSLARLWKDTLVLCCQQGSNSLTIQNAPFAYCISKAPAIKKTVYCSISNTYTWSDILTPLIIFAVNYFCFVYAEVADM